MKATVSTMDNELNAVSLDSLCAALAYAVGIEAPDKSAPADKRLCDYADASFDGKKADRIVMYNPDAVGQWIYEKYAHLMKAVCERTELALPYCTVMPSVTPVCFGTMYTGAQPCVHGIRKYEKPVIKIETLFDAFIKSGKKPVIIADSQCSIGKIFLERNMDYFIFDSRDEINAKAVEIICEDNYDLVVIYNGNYDATMHKQGPESVEALAELHANAEIFSLISRLVESRWTSHNTLMGFAMDHGCHEIDGSCGSHGLDMPEDLNIVHLYKAYPSTM